MLFWRHHPKVVHVIDLAVCSDRLDMVYFILYSPTHLVAEEVRQEQVRFSFPFVLACDKLASSIKFIVATCLPKRPTKRFKTRKLPPSKFIRNLHWNRRSFSPSRLYPTSFRKLVVRRHWQHRDRCRRSLNIVNVGGIPESIGKTVMKPPKP